MTKILIKRGTALQWTASTTALLSGELGLDITNNIIKVGDGTTLWNSLSGLTLTSAQVDELAQDAISNAFTNGTHTNIIVTYNDNANSISLSTGPDVVTTTSLGNTLSDPSTGYVPISDVANPDGVASLDSTGNVPLSQLGNLVDGAPAALDTLNELAAALGDDPNYATTITTALGDKVSKSGGSTILPSSASIAGLSFTPATGQTANLLEFIGGPAGGGVRVGPNGNIFDAPAINSNYAFTASAGASGVVPATIKAASGQTANLLEYKHNNGITIGAVRNDGAVMVNTIVPLNSNTGTYASFGSDAVVFNSRSTSTPTTIIKGVASQTANLQEWQDSAGTVLSWINPSGGISLPRTSTIRFNGGVGLDRAYITSNISNDMIFATAGGVESFRLYGGAQPNGALITVGNAVAVGLTIKAAASQTANLQEWQNSSSTVLAKVTSTGMLDITPSSGSTVSFRNSSGVLTFWGGNSSYYMNTGFYMTGGSWADGRLGVDTQGAANKGLVVRGAASQTADLQQWQDSTGGILSKVDSRGRLIIGNPTSTAYDTYVDVRSIGGYPTLKVGETNQNRDIDIIWDVTGQFGQIATNSYGYPISIGNAYVYINNSANSGKVGINNTGLSAQLGITNAVTTNVGLIVKGVASQTANLQEWQNSSGTVLSRIDANGLISLPGSSWHLLNDQETWYKNIVGFYQKGASHVFRRQSDDADLLTIGTNGNTSILLKDSGNIGLIVKGYTSQTADLQQWQNSSGTALAKVDNTGNVTAPSYNLSNSLYSLRKTIKKTVGDGTAVPINTTYDLFQFNFSQSLQGTFYFQVSLRGSGYGQNLTYSLPATYAMDWLANGYSGNPFTNNTTWVSLSPQTFSGRHLMVGDNLKLQARVDANIIYFRLKANAALSSGGNSPYFDVYIQHSEEFAGCTITEYSTVGTDTDSQTTLANFLSSKGGTTELFNPVTIFSNSASNTPIKIKAAASQTANLQEWQNSSGTVLARIASTGQLLAPSIVGSNFQITSGGVFSNGATSAPANTQAYFLTTAATNVGLVVKGAASQTADLQQWQNSAGTVLAKVDASGAMFTTTAAAGTNTTQVATTEFVQTEIISKSDKITTINAQSTSYTLATSDSDKLVEMSGGGTLTITDSSSFPVGFTCNILQTGSSQVTIAGNGFTPNATPGLKLRAQWSSATLVKRALNSWVVMGDLSA